jgi:Rab GTPase-binding effector protein 1
MESENYKQSPEEQFNQQRALMKQLYVTKEKECNQLKHKIIHLKKELDEASSQLVIAEYNREKDLEDQKIRSEQEIQTLQQLIQETCDETTLAHNEMKRLHDENERMKQEMTSLRESIQQQVSKQWKILNDFLLPINIVMFL